MAETRILSMDGGGSSAGVHARTLGKLYGPQTPGHEIVRQFDLLAGNSGGSIVLTALCCDYTPREIDEFYSDPATLRRMFSPTWASAIPLVNWFIPRYSSTGKFEALKWIFDRRGPQGGKAPSTILLRDWPTYLPNSANLLVTAFDYDRERAAFFRSNAASPAKSTAPGVDPTLVEAVHASTNAPLPFFDKPAEIRERRYWDGAMGGYNNPVLAAVVEALAYPGVAVENVRVLSLGVGTHARPPASEEAPPPLGKPRDGTCLFSAFRKAATVIFGDPPDAATFHAHVALRQPLPAAGEAAVGNLVRLCPLVRPIWHEGHGPWRLPHGLCEADFKGLIELQLDGREQRDVDLIRKMTDLWLADAIPNQPIRMGDHMRCDIGHETFSEAAAHWRKIAPYRKATPSSGAAPAPQ